ncbi:LIP2P2 [Symbiodinium microadriaticum]|nr:LIP2P2 [Symbiodinium microadriaticum]
MLRRKCHIFDLTKVSSIDYVTTWRYQRSAVENIHLSKFTSDPYPDCLILMQDPCVYTLGKGGTPANIKFNTLSKDSAVYRVSRGGEVTWHGPGQLVAYPIVDLTRHKKDLRWYINKLEECVIRALRSYGIEGGRSDVNPGVWVGRRKICAVGVAASRWITMHGLALNITCDLSAYANIIPCGISPDIGGVTSIITEAPALTNSDCGAMTEVGQRQHAENVFFERVKRSFIDIFVDEFQFDREDRSHSELQRILLSSSCDIQNEELQAVHRESPV